MIRRRWFGTQGLRWMLLIPVLLVGCTAADMSAMNRMLGVREAADYPKASPDATVVLYLWSNENCEFFVDGVSVITGKAVRILVTPREHRVVCKPEHYRAKEEYIVPPFDPNHPIRFTFLIGDRLDAAENK